MPETRPERRSDWLDILRRPEWLAMFSDERMRIEEFTEDGTLVVRAELPGVDPDEDVDVSVHDGILTLEAHRREERKQEGKGWYRSEFSYGAVSRSIQLPRGVQEDAVTATYTDGILEVRVPLGEEADPATKKIAVTRS